MPFASRGGFLAQPTAAGNTRRTGTASTNSSQTWTVNGSGAVTDTSIKKYGTASMNLALQSDEIAASGADFLAFGTGDFCVEWWMYIDSMTGHGASCDLLALNQTGGMNLRIARKKNTDGLSSVNPKYFHVAQRNIKDMEAWDMTTGSSDTGNWTTGQWYYCVFQRKSADTSFWRNGVLKTVSHTNSGGVDTVDFASNTGSSTVYLGTQTGASNGVGPVHIDEICFSNSWRYADPSSDLDSLPSGPFTVDQYTTQLLHMDGSNGGTSFANATS